MEIVDEPQDSGASAAANDRGYKDERGYQFVRSEESFQEKWNYVRDNPARAGLAPSFDDWPYFGRIESLEQWP